VFSVFLLLCLGCTSGQERLVALRSPMPHSIGHEKGKSKEKPSGFMCQASK